MDVALQRLLLGRDGRSEMLTGLRGVGKTVLLNEFEQLANGRGYFHEHIEVSEDGDLPARLAAAFRRVLLSMDAKRRIGERVRRALGVLKAFTIRLPNGPELSIDVEAVSGPADSGDLATDLAGLFVELGEVARDHNTGVLITIDELHYVKTETLEALIMGLHRATQLILPITIAAAGLPSLATLTGEAKSYAERLFTFPVIDSLTPDQVRDALIVPVADEGVSWTEGALDRLAEVTHGLPVLPPGVRQAGVGRLGRTRHHQLGRRRTEHPGCHGRARRRLLPGPHRPDRQPGAGLPPGHGGARARSEAVVRGGGAVGEEDHRP